MEKNLGLNKFYKKMSREQRFNKMKENQENGKRMQEEMKRKVEISIQGQDEEKINDMIAHLAEKIVIEKNIPMADAMAEANEYFLKLKK